MGSKRCPPWEGRLKKLSYWSDLKILEKSGSESDSFGITGVFCIEFSVKKSRLLNELLSRGFCLTEDQVPEEEFYFCPSVHSSICPSALSICPFVRLRLLFLSRTFVLVRLFLKLNLLGPLNMAKIG